MTRARSTEVAGTAARERSSGGRDYFTPGEAARLLHVSPKTIIRWANDRRIPFTVTMGGHRRFLRSDIEALVASLRREVADPS